jgi:protein-histidine pros-kinase
VVSLYTARQIAPFPVRSRDEIGVLAESFGRMRKSLVHAMKILDA